MNVIATFRLCTLTDGELASKVDKLVDKMYINNKVPIINIPARPNSDFDLLVGELMLRFMELSEGRRKNENKSDKQEASEQEQKASED